MLFRQFFDVQSCTYSYLLASGQGREAVLIDPVLEQTNQYLQAIEQLDLQLVRAFDTHIHADHVTALGKLRDITGCVTVMGEQSQAACVSEKVSDEQELIIDGLKMSALYTPGHTQESFSFVIEGKVFTGDLLLIRGTGRTDFQGGDAGQSWDSITKRIFTLDDNTQLYPGHDYKGWTVSSVAEEKRYNPRLAGKTREEYIDIMDNLNLPDPKMMDVAVSANLQCGQIL